VVLSSTKTLVSTKASLVIVVVASPVVIIIIVVVVELLLLLLMIVVVNNVQIIPFIHDIVHVVIAATRLPIELHEVCVVVVVAMVVCRLRFDVLELWGSPDIVIILVIVVLVIEMRDIAGGIRIVVGDSWWGAVAVVVELGDIVRLVVIVVGISIIVVVL